MASRFFQTWMICGMTVLSSACSNLTNNQYSDIEKAHRAGVSHIQVSNEVAPGLNDINTCPKGMVRVEHKVAANVDGNIVSASEGGEHSYRTTTSQSHKCVTSKE